MPSERTNRVTEMLEAGLTFSPNSILAVTSDGVANEVYEFWMKKGKPEGVKLVIVIDGKANTKSIKIGKDK